MTNRTIKVLGWGSGTANLIAKLDNEIIFSGEVTLVERIPANDTEQTQPTLFTFEIPLEFKGVKKMSISCQTGEIRLGQIVGNYTETEMGGITYGSGPDIFTDVADYDSNYDRDPRANVTINGEPQSANRALGKGTWHWNLTAGDVIEHDLKIDIPGMED